MLAFPHVARSAPPTDTDVVIIGAGAAGLAAARVLKKRGIRFELIEIRHRIGGRAETNHEYFGVPVDFGCSELHNAKLNPWISYAREIGFAVKPLPDGNSVYDAGQALDRERLRALKEEFEQRQQRLERACTARRDISVADALAASRSNRSSQWTDAFNLWQGPVSAGIDLNDWSVLDWCASRAGDDWYAPAGFGALIAHFGRAIPVHLRTRAERISWSGRAVDVQTDRGSISAKAAIVTIPVSVLKAGFLQFTPALPNWKLRALDGMVTAHYTKVLLKFQSEIVEQPHGSWIAHKVDGREGFSYWYNPGGHGVTQAIAGGSFALELELAGADAAVDVALSQLREIIGTSVDEAFVEGTATVWSQDPYARGAWVQARPGHADARGALLRPLAGRVFFAGEANHDVVPTTAGGAAIVGDAVGRHLAGAIDRL